MYKTEPQEDIAVLTCNICKESIFEQQEYLEDYNGWFYCEECIKDRTHYAYTDTD